MTKNTELSVAQLFQTWVSMSMLILLPFHDEHVVLCKTCSCAEHTHAYTPHKQPVAAILNAYGRSSNLLFFPSWVTVWSWEEHPSPNGF